MYTSGTTGNPKGVMLTHESIICASRIKTQHIPVNPGEKALCVLPLFHSGGLNDLAFSSMYAAATIVLCVDKDIAKSNIYKSNDKKNRRLFHFSSSLFYTI
jgi:Acyl-CoA synthetases (AMP-forming)/AMP-acid ligases II